jgi:predicted dehydrogenase
MPNQQTLKVGIVGAGKQSEDWDIRRFQALGNEANVVAISDLDFDRAQRVAAAFNIPAAYKTLADMVAGQAIDAVAVVTPHNTHEEQTTDALALGKHVFCEKPMATNVGACVNMAVVARQMQRVLSIGYQYAYATSWALQQIRAGRIDPIGASLYWLRESNIPDAEHFWIDPATGGVSLDLPGHLLAALLTIVRDVPVHVQAIGSREQGVKIHGSRFAAEDSLTATIGFSNGFRAKLDVSWATGVPPLEELGLILHGRNGERLELPFLARRTDAAAHSAVLRIPSDTGPGAIEVGPAGTTYWDAILLQTRDFIAACKGQGPLLFSDEQAVMVEMVVAALRDSARLHGALVAVV